MRIVTFSWALAQQSEIATIDSVVKRIEDTALSIAWDRDANDDPT
jgi:hypothetical protein